MKKETLGEGKFLRLCRDGRWEWVERKNCTGVVIIVAASEAKEAILVEQYRPSLQGRVIEFPAGLVGDLGEEESLEAAAKREFLEETGFVAKHWTRLIQGPPSAGMSPEVVTFFLAQDLSQVEEGGGDEYEDIQIHRVPLVSILEWLRAKENEGKWVDPKVYSGLYFLQASRA